MENRFDELVSLIKKLEGESKISLREHLEKVIDIKFAHSERDISTAKGELERRLAGLNDLRKEYTTDREKDRNEFVRRGEHNIMVTKYDDNFKTLNTFKDNLQGSISGKASMNSVYLAWVIAIIAIILHFLK